MSETIDWTGHHALGEGVAKRSNQDIPAFLATWGWGVGDVIEDVGYRFRLRVIHHDRAEADLLAEWDDRRWIPASGPYITLMYGDLRRIWRAPRPDDAAQPAPVPNASPAAWSLVVRDMADRDVTGAAKYGTRLQPGNGRDTLRDAYEEALDLAAYLRTAIYERDGK
jgi:hypothetical protein